jgi:hypothetical protein
MAATPAAIMLEKVNLHLEALRQPTNNHDLEVHLARQALGGLYMAISKDSGETIAAMKLHRKSQAENKVLRERILMLDRDLKSRQKKIDETTKTVAELWERLTQNDIATKAKVRLTKENEKLRAESMVLKRSIAKEQEDGERRYRELEKRMDGMRDRERGIKEYMYLVQASVDRQDAIRKMRATGRGKNISDKFDSAAEVFEYTIIVRTGDKKGAATTGNVSVTLHGGSQMSEKLRLENDIDNFQRGREDTFKLYLAENLGDLRELTIEHDNGGAAPSWFVDNVTVSFDGKNSVFECNQWLAKDKDDGKITKRLTPGSNQSETVMYSVTVVTGDKRGAGTDANVTMSLTGGKNDSGERRLESGNNDFERGAEDHFTFECLDLGKLSKLKIGHDNTGSMAAWFLDRVIVTKDGEQPVVFPCYEWFDKANGDGYIERDLRPGDGKAPELTPYKITVVTGTERGAGTDANVTIKIKGTAGDSGMCVLESGANNFEKGQTDLFDLLLPDLGKLQHIDISHDDSGMLSAWLLDQVRIVDANTGVASIFMAQQWLKDDTLSLRLLAGGDPPPPPTEYKITVHTGECRGAGTDANVYIQLFGMNGEDSPEINLESGNNDFEKGQIDVFKCKCQDLGDLKKVRIRQDNSGPAAAWFLEKIVVEQADKRFDFPCGRWLRESEKAGDNYELTRELFEDDIDPRDLLIQYEIQVLTGSAKGSGTDANVDLVLYGPEVDTGPRRLESGANDFERNETNRFVVEAEDVGEIQKIKLAHDNSSLAPGWFCETVTITNTKTSKRWEIPVKKWFDTSQGDGLISRDIRIGEPAEQMTKYRILTTTANQKGAGTDAEVKIKLFGETSMQTGDLKLESGKNDFEKGNTDEFFVEVPDIGPTVQKIKLWHDNSSLAPGWKIDQVLVENLTVKPTQTFMFPLYRWLSKDEDDGKIEVVQEAADMEAGFRPVVTWTVTVKTASVKGAGTDSDVFIKLFGVKDQKQVVSENLSLESGQDDFERGKTDTFKVQTKDLGELHHVRIGHNGHGIGSGWMLEWLEVKDDGVDGPPTHFQCNRWFDESADDGLIVRDLEPGTAGGASADHQQKAIYDIEVITSDKRGAGTDANVFIELVGQNNFTGKLPLENSKNNFERAKTDVFTVTADEVGDLQKIRIGHDGNGMSDGWFLEKVTVKNTVSNGQWIFGCNRWLASDEDDGSIVRELVQGDAAQLIKYHVCVATGNIRGAGTDANVTAVLYGVNGTNSGERTLDSKGNNFERNRQDEFVVECADLGGVDKVRIGHDGNGMGAGWFLAYVEVWEPGNEGNKIKFNCERWLDKNEDDGSIVRLLTKDGGEAAVYTTYEVTVYTGSVKGAGTDANVFINMHGTQMSGDQKLSSSKNDFERGKINKFLLKLPSLGDLQKIRIGHDGDGLASGWYCDKLMIRDLSNPKQMPWYFPCYRWLDSGHDDQALEVVINATSAEDAGDQPKTYTVTVITGNRRGAGTDANVFVELVGEEKEGGLPKETGRLQLESSRNNFERGKTDEFHMTAPNVGVLRSIRIGHDAAGFGAGWFLDKVFVKDDLTNEQWAFPCYKWLDKKPSEDNPEGLTVRELLPASKLDAEDDGATGDFFRLDVITGDRRGAGTDANVFVELTGDKASSGTKKLDARRSDFERGNTDTFRLEVSTALGTLKKIRIGHDNSGWNAGWYLERVMVTNERTGDTESFSCQRWLDKKEDDGQIIRELLPGEAEGIAMMQYKVLVRTGDRRAGGTSARVFMNIIGAEGETGDRPLDSKRSNFSRGAEDEFIIEAVDIGEIQKIRIGHDNKGMTPGWYFEGADVINTSVEPPQSWNFKCDRWLARDEDDKQIVREVAPFGDDMAQPSAGAVQYTVEVYTGDVRYAGTDANVAIQIFGENGDTGTRQLQNKWKNDFERGQTDVFTLEAADLGKIERVRIGHDGKGAGAGWFLDKIVVKNPDMTDEVCDCGRWLDQKEDDGLTERELFPQDSGRQSSQMARQSGLVPYKVSIHTADVYGAGTDANIHLTMVGEDGSSTEFPLTNGRGKFERDAHDEFTLEAAELGELTKVRIGHDNNGFMAGWMLGSVSVTHNGSGERKGQVWRFPCGRWFDRDEDDGQVERELLASDSDAAADGPGGSMIKYAVRVFTGDEPNAGTDANVSITLVGDNGTSGTRKLTKSGLFANAFETGKTDDFEVECPSLGPVQTVVVSHDGAGIGAGWQLEKIEVVALDGTVVFTNSENGGWLDAGMGDEKLERRLYADGVEAEDRIDPDPAKVTTTYKVTVHTGTVRHAGTNADVFITVYGADGTSGERKLDSKRGNFENGSVDTFSVDSAELGDLEKLRIRHDSAGLGAGWFLDKVEVRSELTGNSWNFPCNMWLDKKEGDGLISRDLVAEPTA